jgi:putative heme-binding domain-containing protein
MRPIILCAAALSMTLLAGLTRSADKKDPYAGHVAQSPPKAPADEGKAFQLPPGFEAQLVAAEPDIHKPLNIAFDDRGRLWVSDTVEYPFLAGPGQKPRDSIKVLEDFGPDGRARKITTFADGLNIPIGILPLPGGRPQEALAFNIPFIYLLRDNLGTGWADERRVLYAKFGSRDTHGMTSAFTWGFDGWAYACHGFANDSTVKAADASSVTMQSGNTYRMKADGSRVEQFTHGQVNPFGLSFDPLGNLYSCDCHSQPIYQLLRGGYYPSFGKPHDGLGFAPEMFTGYKGSTAISGITYYAADAFPAAYRDTVFIGDVVTNQIVQFRLAWEGSTPKATVHDFLNSKDPWFRPVAIVLGPDGALYVADFYNRIIGHYEVPLTHPGRDRERGRIWRIVYRGSDNKATPAPRSDWTKASTAELVNDLRHPNIAVRTQAANQLVLRGPEAVSEVRKALAGKDAWQWVHGLWVLQRLGKLDSVTLATAMKHSDRAVRTHAQRVLSERRDFPAEERALALAGLKDVDANVKRAAAEALGRHPAVENIRPLLDLRQAVPEADTHLLYVVRMALRDQLRPAPSWANLPRPLSERDERALADVALGVPTAEAADFLLAYLKHCSEPRERLANMVHHVARYGRAGITAPLLDYVRHRQPEDGPTQVALFHAIEHGTQERGGRLDDAVRAWAVELTGRLLSSAKGEDVQAGIDLAGSLKLEPQQARVAELALSRTVPEGQRGAALNALAAIDAGRHAGVIGRVLADAETPIGLREQAASLLARANQPGTREQLILALPAAPARLQNVIATGLAGSREGAEKLLETVAAGKASARLLQERGVSLKLQESHLPNLKERVDRLTAGLPKADEKVQELLRTRREGFVAARKDAALGAQVFSKNCAACHQVGGQGAKIGPQLDGIGARGLDRLLEDVLDPNRNVDQAFRLTTLELENGQVVSGLLLREEGEVLVLADAQGKEVRVRKADVAQRSTSQMSPMPANFAEQVSQADFYNLLAYLLAQQVKPMRAPGK